MRKILVLMICALMSGCATVYIADGNVRETAGDTKEKHIGATDDTIMIDDDDDDEDKE